VLVPACLVAVVAAATVHGLLASSASKQTATSTNQAESGAGAVKSQPNPPATRTPLQGVTTKTPTFDQALTPSAIPSPSPGRYQNYQADLRVRVKDLDALGDKTARAMQITQQLGGFVASLSQSSTAGQPGEADLVLRIPVARVTDAMVQLSALGTVLSQNVSIVDLQRVVQQQRQQIRSLQLQIARITAALQQSGLSVDERLRLQFLLDDTRRNLANATGRNKATLREAALSRIAFSLTTQKPIAPAKKHHSSFFGRAVSSAFHFLGGAGAVAVAALIIISPLLVLAILIWLGVRGFRRREAQRLLGTT
jgi:Domain of unknown function (DUF4349)